MGRLKTDTWEQMLEQMEQEGVGFYLNGKKTAPREIIRTCCMREKAVYMPDFVMDEEGKLCEVRVINQSGQTALLGIGCNIGNVHTGHVWAHAGAEGGHDRIPAPAHAIGGYPYGSGGGGVRFRAYP